MESAEVTLTAALALSNLAAGVGLAVPIARLLARVTSNPDRVVRYGASFAGCYFVECVPFPVGMATQVFTVGLAFVWGVLFGLWVRARASATDALRTAAALGLYTSLPTASFSIVLPAMWLMKAGDVLSSEQGIRFGIPEFLPWPVNTILGFCVVLFAGTVVLKTVITTGVVALLVHRGKDAQVADA